MNASLKHIDNYIFDLDGTILNSSAKVLKCLKLAYIETNTPYEESRINMDVIGPPLRGILKIISPEIKDEKLIDKLVDAYFKHYYGESNSITIYNGMYELLSSLKAKGKRLFIATNNPKASTLKLLKMFDLNFFQDVYSVDKFDNIEMLKKRMVSEIIETYGLDKNKTAMVGDSMHDCFAAKKNSIFIVGVLWGYEKNKEEFIKSVDLAVKSAEELLVLL